MDSSDRIIEVLRTFSKQPALPDPGESLFDSGYLDSFAFPEVITALEKEFDIHIPDSDAHPRKFETVERIERYVAHAVKSANS
jgi:acyl carrier protein